MRKSCDKKWSFFSWHIPAQVHKHTQTTLKAGFYQNQTPSLSFTGSKHTEHWEQQAADLHDIHYHDRNTGHQLRIENTRVLKHTLTGNDKQFLRTAKIIWKGSVVDVVWDIHSYPILILFRRHRCISEMAWQQKRVRVRVSYRTAPLPPEDNSLSCPRTLQLADPRQHEGLESVAPERRQYKMLSCVQAVSMEDQADPCINNRPWTSAALVLL